MKECGECSLCCKLISVPGLAKAGEWCPYCKPGSKKGGCTIHDSRPSFCVGYHCFWRAESWPDKYRPDKCKVIFEALPGVYTILISVDPSKPDAWKEKDILEVIEKLRKKGRPLILKTINDSEMFLPEGWDKKRVLMEIKKVIDLKKEWSK
jgi:hypothetical protein